MNGRGHHRISRVGGGSIVIAMLLLLSAVATHGATNLLNRLQHEAVSHTIRSPGESRVGMRPAGGNFAPMGPIDRFRPARPEVVPRRGDLGDPVPGAALPDSAPNDVELGNRVDLAAHHHHHHP